MLTARANGDSPWNEEFLDLICSDPELLTAELDAIIAGSWADPSEDPSPVSPSARTESCHNVDANRKGAHDLGC